ncbi:hypothetical protein SAMN05443248_2743 [Bradyrhizobium erythrophlei]|uniref:Uncharacterized protein n=1 Tax=Bradyrhizobium erythrophlei TaxID=1437360 RepID=A0A1M5MVI0_9BRAD|nr:hypothetical protein SAMN05443248_2743 [Bradyrhizobium erythrophlei]
MKNWHQRRIRPASFADDTSIPVRRDSYPDTRKRNARISRWIRRIILECAPGNS